MTGTNSAGAGRQWSVAGSVAQSTGRIQVLIQLHWDLKEDKSPPSSVLSFSSVKGENYEMATQELLVKTLSLELENRPQGPLGQQLAYQICHWSFTNSVLSGRSRACCGQHTLRNFPLLPGSKYVHPHAIHVKNKAGNGTSNDP